MRAAGNWAGNSGSLMADKGSTLGCRVGGDGTGDNYGKGENTDGKFHKWLLRRDNNKIVFRMH